MLDPSELHRVLEESQRRCSHMTPEGLPETAVESARAEAWSADIAGRTLATGDQLLEHICRAKLANRVPYTAAERAYLDRVTAARRVELQARGRCPQCGWGLTACCCLHPRAT